MCVLDVDLSILLLLWGEDRQVDHSFGVLVQLEYYGSLITIVNVGETRTSNRYDDDGKDDVLKYN